MGASELVALLWRHWQVAWSLDVGLAVVAGLYLSGTRRVRAPWPRRRTAAFLAGIGWVAIALQSGIGSWDDRLLSVHMVQHLMLLEVAPVLLLLGQPGLLALRAAPRQTAAMLIGWLAHVRRFTHPLACLFFFYAAIALTHLPWFYDATLRSSALHESEHGLYLLAGLLFWWPVLDADPLAGRRLGGFTRFGYVVAGMLPMTVIGALLYRSTTLVYAPYAAPARALGISAMHDEHKAGGIMWVFGGLAMTYLGLWQAMAAMVAEERRQKVRDLAAASSTSPAVRR